MKWGERRRRRFEAVPARDLVSDVLRGNHVAEDLRAHRIVTEWKQMVGARNAARTLPSAISEKGVLSVRVSNSSWMQELGYIKDEMLRAIQKALGDPPLVTDLRFHLAHRVKHDEDDRIAVRLATSRREARRPPKRRPLPPPAEGEDRERIEAECATVEDAELRAIIERARIRLDR